MYCMMCLDQFEKSDDCTCDAACPDCCSCGASAAADGVEYDAESNTVNLPANDMSFDPSTGILTITTSPVYQEIMVSRMTAKLTHDDAIKFITALHEFVGAGVQ